MSGDKVCFDIKRKEIQSCGLHLLVLTIFSPDNYASVAGTIETYLLSSLPTLKLTVPSTKAKRVWSLPIPMFSPGWNSVPL